MPNIAAHPIKHCGPFLVLISRGPGGQNLATDRPSKFYTQRTPVQSSLTTGQQTHGSPYWRLFPNRKIPMYNVIGCTIQDNTRGLLCVILYIPTQDLICRSDDLHRSLPATSMNGCTRLAVSRRSISCTCFQNTLFSCTKRPTWRKFLTKQHWFMRVKSRGVRDGTAINQRTKERRVKKKLHRVKRSQRIKCSKVIEQVVEFMELLKSNQRGCLIRKPWVNRGGGGGTPVLDPYLVRPSYRECL